MTESTFLKPEGLPARWASPHGRTVRTVAWSGYPYNRKHGPSSTLHSSVVEMCSWAIVTLNQGSGERWVLDPSSYEEMWTPRAQTGGGGMNRSVGLSWFIGESRGERTISHGGRDVGFNTSLVLMPDREIAVVVLCNFAPAPATALASAALDVALGHEPRMPPPPASVPVLRTLADDGVEAAVEHWNTMRLDEPDRYDFRERQFLDAAGMALQVDHVEDARLLARLCVALLSEQSLRFASRYVDTFLTTHPEHETAAAMREILASR